MLQIEPAHLTMHFTPEKFLFDIGGWDGGGFGLSWESGALKLVRHDFGPFGGPILKEAQPTEAEWTRFWNAVEQSGAWSWNPSYEPVGYVVLDGTQWSLELAWNGKTVACGGSNAYPGCADMEIEPESEFGKFYRALSDLIQFEFDADG